MAMASNTSNASSSGSNSASSSTSNSASSSEVGLLPKPKSTSLVWDHFGFKPDETGLKPQRKDSTVCRLCKRSVEAKGGNTSNLFSHLRVHHPFKFRELEAIRKERDSSSQPKATKQATNQLTGQQDIVSTLQMRQKYDKKSKKWHQLTDSVTFCLAKDMIPMYTVEKEGFWKMLSCFDPQYQLPGRKYFSGTAIPALYATTRQKVQEEVDNAEFFASTTDMWSSNTSEPYLSFTIHFVDSNWELHSHCLQTLYTPQDHTADNLAAALTDTLEGWALDPAKHVCITTDNGANLLCATTSRLNWTQLSCFGHNLHLAIGNAIKDNTRVSRALGVCRNVVGSFAHSWKRKRSLEEVKERLGLPKHSLVIDCATRWGSMQKMVERVLKQEQAIRQVLGADRKTSHLVPTWQDIEVLEAMNAALDQLADFTDMLSGEKMATASSLKAVLHILKTEILAVKSADSRLTADIKNRILIYLEQKYSDHETNSLLNLASYLDPRFMTEYVDEDDLQLLKDKLVDEGSGIEVEERKKSSDRAREQDNEAAQPPASKRRKLGSWLKRAQTSRPAASDQDSPVHKVEREMEQYERAPRADPDSNPLEWWRLYASTYPLLSILSKKYLCICASSASSERAFSTSGHIVSKKRCSLKPALVDMLTFLAKNLLSHSVLFFVE